ncbi:MAG: homoserine O-acetyltransferase [Akkermansiaceae bacterium]|nr:homoserine O-acetyltransferase [Akkermansiaceae bacterium]
MVQTRIFELGDFQFDSGETLPDVVLAYETYGTLAPDAGNAVLLFHALTGSHHAHGRNESLPAAGSFWQPENYDGWWDRMIGPGKPLDTDKYFIVCANYLGSCYGSTGPASPAPDGEPWGSRFPLVTANDQARAQVRLLEALGIERFSIVGPSVGGMLSLATTALYPERVRSVIIIGASCAPPIEHKLSVFEQILAIELDAKYRAGRYPLADPPARGLALARIICHKLFVYQRGLEKRARRGLTDRRGMLEWYAPTRNTESYMLHQGTKFAKRFDANAYIRIVNMWAGFDLPALAGAASLDAVFAHYAAHRIPFALFSIDTDCCFTPRGISHFHRRLVKNGVQAEYTCIHSHKGHDSFLLEPELYEKGICAYLARS